MLTESTAMIGGYLTAERELGRIASDADVDGAEPDAAAVGRVVDTVLAAAAR